MGVATLRRTLVSSSSTLVEAAGEPCKAPVAAWWLVGSLNHRLRRRDGRIMLADDSRAGRKFVGILSAGLEIDGRSLGPGNVNQRVLLSMMEWLPGRDSLE